VDQLEAAQVEAAQVEETLEVHCVHLVLWVAAMSLHISSSSSPADFATTAAFFPLHFVSPHSRLLPAMIDVAARMHHLHPGSQSWKLNQLVDSKGKDH
jgi:hypothetical protein